MKKNEAEVAALAEVVRTVFADMAKRKRPVGPDAEAALALVERLLAGEAIGAEALQAASDAANQDAVPLEQREPDRALRWAAGAAGNLAWMAKQERGWQDGERATMDAAEFALSSLDVAGVKDREALERLRVAALAKALAAKPAKPEKPAKAAKAAKPAKAPTQPSPAALQPFLGVVAHARLARLAPVFDPARRGGDVQVRALLGEHAYPAHAAVLAFDRRWGGLVIADSPGETGRDWIFGAYACLDSGAHAEWRQRDAATGKDALVPVVYSPNDLIYFLDGHGAGWAQDTIEDPAPVRCAKDGDRMVARILLYQIVFERESVELEGKRGRDAAAQLSLPVIPEATDDYVRVWGDARALVLEERVEGAGEPTWKTRISADSKQAVKTVVQRLG